jgi:hypothetical protein
MVDLKVVVLLGAPTSLASNVVIGPHYAAVTHVGDSSEVGQREHIHGSAGYSQKVMVWVSVSWWLVAPYLAPPRQVGGGVPGGMRSVDTPPPLRRPPPRRWRPAGGPVAGAQSAKIVVNQVGCNIPHACHMRIILRSKSFCSQVSGKNRTPSALRT